MRCRRSSHVEIESLRFQDIASEFARGRDAAASHLDTARRAFETLRLRGWAERVKRVGAELAGL